MHLTFPHIAPSPDLIYNQLIKNLLQNGTGETMGIVLLGLLTIMEIALVVITFTRFGEKVSWLRNRAVCRAFEWFTFVLILLSPS